MNSKKTERNNVAFVFIKPHANNLKTQEKVASVFASKGITVVQEGEFTGDVIDRDMLIDQHYYAIASKATILKPEEIPVPEEKFLETFGVSWADVLASKSAFNALDACKYLEIDVPTLNKLWLDCKKVKFGGGFYCGVIEMEGKAPIYTFNAFFMTMRSKFVSPECSIHYYVVEFAPETLSWSDFRGKVLGPTDPSLAPPGSLRGDITKNYLDYDLTVEPTVSDNCVHASASPFEGLAERMNWLKVSPENDPFGSRVLAAGISADTVRQWSVDPQVNGKSIFDQLEDKDADECISILKQLFDITNSTST